jgi:glycosyltransferase involved in cell wall biosynthesis
MSKKNTRISWLVSILICTYNAENTIQQTLKSCLSQSYQKIEILIHDDQSSDKTISIISKIQDKKIKIISSWYKLWPYWWLNFLLQHTQGEYIAIQDHDDLRHPEKLKKQINFLQNNKNYIWCGTKTLMRYQWDSKGFEYFLWKENYYTIHPSLVFRYNKEYQYPIDIIYMNDAYFQKKILCKEEKLIYNIEETLTFHLIKSGGENFSYKWFTYSRKTLYIISKIHPLRYVICIVWWETIRKILYPVFQSLNKNKRIDKLERKPFEILWEKTLHYSKQKIRKLGFIIS